MPRQGDPAFVEQGADALLDLEHLAGQAEQGLSGFGHPHLPRFAGEQQNVVAVFKLAYLVGHRGLRDVERAGRAGKPAMQRHVMKCA